MIIPKTRLAIPKKSPDENGMVATSSLHGLASLCRKNYGYDADDNQPDTYEVIDNLWKNENNNPRHKADYA